MTLTHEQRMFAKAERQYGLINCPQLRELGIDRQTMWRLRRSGRWTDVLPCVYGAAGIPPSWERSVMAACLWGAPYGAASHRTAARLWGLDGFEAAPWIEVTVQYGHDVDHPSGVLAHRTRRPNPRDLTERWGIPATRVERTLVDLCAVADEEQLEIAMESAFRMGLTSMERLYRRTEELGGRRGLGQLRRLLAMRQIDPAHSRWEVKLLRLIREGGLPEPIRQFRVFDGVKERKIDLAYEDATVGLEYDSFRHHSGRSDWERDHTRFARLTAMGWRILPITMDDIDLQPRDTRNLIAQALQIV